MKKDYIHYPYIEQIKKNRDILRALLSVDNLTLRALSDLGFTHNTYTHTLIHKQGVEFRFYIDLGLAIINDKIVIEVFNSISFREVAN